MWSVILLINSFILTFVSLYFIYSIGMAILVGAWKAFFIALITFLFFTFTEVAIGSISE
jgi:hypothetical protein